MSDLRLDGRTAIVTGAGNGLGRSHALLLAANGAAVVVNDLGTDRTGQGASAEAAERVVEEIEQAGGAAVANPDGVHTAEGADRLIQTALDEFGGLDIVVNNAGILRDRSFKKMTHQEWQGVLDVHLTGTFNVTRAAWGHLIDAGYGRIISTASGAGIYGNFGQANYSAAKMGIVGLTRTLAIEGQRKGVLANVLAPVAASRMTEDIFPEDQFERFRPEFVSPLVAYLASEACRETGRIFAAGGGYFSRIGLVEGDGVAFDQPPTVDQLAERWDDLRDLSKGHELPSPMAHMFNKLGMSQS